MAKRGWTRRGALAALATSGAAAACGRTPEAPRYTGTVTFDHGVASGDPGIDRVVIWTRVTPSQNGPVPVRWVVARDRNLRNVVQTGVVETTELRDYTVKVDATGLRAGAPYFYGFLAGDQKSPVGRMRTLPQGDLESWRFAVVSCANYPSGFFNVYEAISRRDDIDTVLHLGDYIYEYGVGAYGGDVGVALGRIPRPEIECISLNDYRLRHAQAKAEPELQAAHAICPWIVAWDDHEIANDAWTGGAENHQANEGAWDARKRAALQAYYEWMPIRDAEPGKGFEAINRIFQFGSLASLAMLETRLLARTKQFEYARDTPLYSTPWDFANPAAPRPVSPAASYPASVRMVPVPYEKIGDDLVAIWNWPRVQAAIANPASPPAGVYFVPDRTRLTALLAADDREMLGDAQERWLGRELTNSHRNGVTWQVLGNQTVMAQVMAPNLSEVPAEILATLDRLSPGASKLMFFTRFGLPFSTDSWDGYPAARKRLLDLVRQAQGNTIVLTGDSHAAWANELIGSDGQRAAVEFAGTSVTSPGYADLFQGLDIDLDAALVERNPEVKWTDQKHRGYLTLSLTKENAQADFYVISTVMTKEFTETRVATFTVRPDDTPSIGALERVTISGTPT